MKTRIKAAIRDPKTMKIYTGESHAHVIDELDDGDKETCRRVRKTYCNSASDPNAEHVGFVGPDGVLLTRAESLKKWGVFQSQDIRRMGL